jgi:DNA invertase Pin-like site-specific DNA recombinase
VGVSVPFLAGLRDRITIHILAAVAELERSFMVERANQLCNHGPAS